MYTLGRPLVCDFLLNGFMKVSRLVDRYCSYLDTAKADPRNSQKKISRMKGRPRLYMYSTCRILDDLVLGGNNDSLLLKISRLDHLLREELPRGALSRVVVLEQNASLEAIV